MWKIAKYIILDILKSKVLIAYTILLSAISVAIFMMDADVTKGLVSVSTVVMIMIPLVSIIFATTYIFNASEFTELLVSQPISRKDILLGKYIGISSSILVSFILGICVPVSVFAFSVSACILMLVGCLLTLAFISLSFLAATLTSDKSKGIGLSLMIWFYCAIVFDGLVLLFLFAFSDYPLEKAMIVLTALNPVDLGRVMILLQLDISALMGYTGALYQKFFGSGYGMAFSILFQLFWIVSPLLFALRIFKKKDL